MKAHCLNGQAKDIAYEVETVGNITTVTIKKTENFDGIEYIDFDYEKDFANEGDEGYMVTPYTSGAITYFKGHNNSEFVRTFAYTMPIFGVISRRKNFLAIVTGMSFGGEYEENPGDYDLVMGAKDGKYYIFPRFNVGKIRPYEDIQVKYIYLPDGSDYNDIAKAYRNYRLERGEMVPLEKRIKNRPILEYAKDSILVRVRMGWKPVPCVVKSQTPENEPPMHIACTFNRVKQLIKAMVNKGIKKADICLVGWNCKGHDGRWPQAFPVEESLGGETGIKELIDYAKSVGYEISCHSNLTDSYEISRCFNIDDIRVRRDGKKDHGRAVWSGGDMYTVCPQKALDNAHRMMPEIAELGFNGIHYCDVLSCVPARECLDEKHPLTHREASEYYSKCLSYIREVFGASSSESGYDYCIDGLDSVLYASYSSKKEREGLIDEIIPLWEIVYHGIVFYNPFGDTLNSVIKDKSVTLTTVEYGGRQTNYIYSKFKTDGGSWMGNSDLILDKDEDLEYTAEKLKESYDIAQELKDIQTAFIDKHSKIADGVFETVYSNGKKIVVDYNKGCYEIR